MKPTGIKKLYYSISEVSKITDLEQYVLRYWESEFEQLKPQKNRAGNRVYTNKEIKLIMHIKKVLRDERYTIEGAKQVLESWLAQDELQQGDLFSESKSSEQSVATNGGVAPKITDPKLREDLLQMKKVLEDMLQQLQ